MKKYLLVIGLLLLALAAFWKLGFADRQTIRVPADWSLHAQYLGKLTFADEHGNLPHGKNLNIYHRDLSVIDWQPDRAVIEDYYRTFDIQTGKTTWDQRMEFIVDPVTARIIEHPKFPEARGRYYIFPPNAVQNEYDFFDYLLSPHVMHFERQEKVAGLALRVYRFQGSIDLTESYKLAGHTFPPGQKVFSCDLLKEMWVEPVTGEIVHIIENSSGDYLVGPEGEKQILDLWSGKTTGGSSKLLIQRAKNILWKNRLHQKIIPGLLLSGGLFCLCSGALLTFHSRRTTA